jgi:hypothetical protein
LYSLNKLTFIFTLSLAQSLPKLERLEISDCGELKYLIREEDGEREIIPESPSFPELKTIIVYDCGKLEYVFPVSVCPSLLSLEVMWIFYSDNLKQIFYNGEGDTLTTYRIIEFPRLRKLALYSTSNYSFFGSKNIPAHLPSLQNLCLSGHEELGNLSTQLQVRPLYFSNNFFLFNLNCQLQYTVISSSRFLKLKLWIRGDKSISHPLNLKRSCLTVSFPVS